MKQAFDFASGIYQRSVDALNKGFESNVGQLAATLQKQTIDSGERVQKTTESVLWAAAAIAAAYLIFGR